MGGGVSKAKKAAKKEAQALAKTQTEAAEAIEAAKVAESAAEVAKAADATKVAAKANLAKQVTEERKHGMVQRYARQHELDLAYVLQMFNNFVALQPDGAEPSDGADVAMLVKLL
jgi:hypothetical protein